MNSNKTALQDFMQLFAGRETIHGVHIPADSKTAGGKQKGKSYTVSKPATEEEYRQHLNGVKGIGLNPLRVDNTVVFAAIDIDSYPLKVLPYLDAIRRTKLPVAAFRSKSGGLHLYLFFNNPEPADKVKSALETIKVVFGLSETTEVFPKQTKLDAAKIGNWINLPYFNAKNSPRYMYSPNGEALSFVDALNNIKVCKIDLAKLSEKLDKLPFSKGPPCLQALYINKQISAENHNRNVFLFNAGIYFKRKNPQNYIDLIQKLNSTLPEPLTESELKNSLGTSLEKGTYSYQCDNPLLNSFCNKAECHLRKFGKATLDISSALEMEQLTQVMADPPYYKWRISGADMIFYSEQELRSQTKFQDLCIRYLHYFPPLVKQSVWTALINKQLKNIKIEEVPKEEQISEKALFYEALCSFTLDRALAKVPEQVMFGQTYFNALKQEYCFRTANFIDFLNKDKNLKLKLVEVRRLLKYFGARATSLNVKMQRIPVWAIHKDWLKRMQDADENIETTEIPDDTIDFTDETTAGFNLPTLEWTEDDKF